MAWHYGTSGTGRTQPPKRNHRQWGHLSQWEKLYDFLNGAIFTASDSNSRLGMRAVSNNGGLCGTARTLANKLVSGQKLSQIMSRNQCLRNLPPVHYEMLENWVMLTSSKF